LNDNAFFSAAQTLCACRCTRNIPLQVNVRNAYMITKNNNFVVIKDNGMPFVNITRNK